jgi:hypothetical protein
MTVLRFFFWVLFLFRFNGVDIVFYYYSLYLTLIHLSWLLLTTSLLLYFFLSACLFLKWMRYVFIQKKVIVRMWSTVKHNGVLKFICRLPCTVSCLIFSLQIFIIFEGLCVETNILLFLNFWNKLCIQNDWYYVMGIFNILNWILISHYT